jgi:hypothetical protein
MKSVGIALVPPILLGLSAWLIVDVFGLEIPEWVVTVLGYLFGWPLLLLNPFIPASDSPNPSAPFIRNGLYLVAIIIDLIAYSLLIYGVLYWREKRNPSHKLNSGMA